MNIANTAMVVKRKIAHFADVMYVGPDITKKFEKTLLLFAACENYTLCELVLLRNLKYKYKYKFEFTFMHYYNLLQAKFSTQKL
jgi:hypothetical protein